MHSTKIVRSEEQIKKQMDKVHDAKMDGGIYPGMTYEQGIEAMLLWLIGECDELPME